MVFVGKKGAENVIASLILFIAVMSLATTATILFKNYTDSSATAVQQQQQRSIDLMNTRISFSLVTYDQGSIIAYLRNTGSTRFDPQTIDVYVDGIRIPRNQGNRTITVLEDTDHINPGIWDPREEVELVVFRTFNTSQTRTLTISTENGYTISEVFSS